MMNEEDIPAEQAWQAKDIKEATEMLLHRLQHYHKRHDVPGIDDVKTKEPKND